MYKLFDSNIDDDDKISVSLESRYESDFVKTAGKRDLPAEVDEVIKNGGSSTKRFNMKLARAALKISANLPQDG